MQKITREFRIFRNKRRLAQSGWNKKAITRDNLAFFPELNLTLNRVKKSGNTSLFLFFSELATGKKIEPQNVNSEKDKRSIRKFDLRTWPGVHTSKSFVCVRDPYVRAISGFLEKVGQERSAKYSGYDGFGDPTADGLERFLSGLGDKNWKHVNRHFWPQAMLVCQPVDDFSCVARLETVHQDMMQFVEELGLDRAVADKISKPNPTERSIPGKITNAAARRELLTPACRGLIEKLYAEDFERFGY